MAIAVIPWHGSCLRNRMGEIVICRGPFPLYVNRTPTGGVALRQPTDGSDVIVYVPPAQVRYLALELARIAAERVG